MKLINDLADQICEEVADAEKYAKWALAVKDDMPTVAQTLYTISGQELTHASMLHDLVARAISDYKAKHGEPPADMLALYNYLHGKQIDNTERVRRYQEMYKA